MVARPASPLYRFRKFARRHKVALATGLIVAAALALGTAVSTWQAVRARSAEADADASRRRAEDFAERLKAANVLLDNARADEHEQRYGLAQRHYTKAAELQPDHYLVWSGRGTLYLHLGLWSLLRPITQKRWRWAPQPTIPDGGGFRNCSCMPAMNRTTGKPARQFFSKSTTRRTGLPPSRPSGAARWLTHPPMIPPTWPACRRAVG